MTIEELARLEWYRDQNLDPNEPVPEGRLTWEECLELANPKHPHYDYCFWLMRDGAFKAAAVLTK